MNISFIYDLLGSHMLRKKCNSVIFTSSKYQFSKLLRPNFLMPNTPNKLNENLNLNKYEANIYNIKKK